jgi:preprotein translocase subunit SecA
MRRLYGTDITVQELEEEVDVDEPGGASSTSSSADALDTYAEREEAFGPELSREIERYVILQIVDTRWREHLESMDYLREGVHLRAMAQKDPLVEYRGEGHAMFEELGRIIREEVVLTLLPRRGAARRGRGAAAAHAGAAGTRVRARAAPRRGRDRRRGRRRCDGARGPAGDDRDGLPKPVVNEHRDIGRNDPCWCGSGKKYKRCHGA